MLISLGIATIHHPYYSRVVCSNCQSSDHDASSYPYYVIFDGTFVTLNNVIEKLNEQNATFENYLREYHLSHETNLSLPSSRPKVSFCDDHESSFPLKSNFVVDTA